MKYCSIPRCSNSTNNKSISFFRFPRNKFIRKKWIESSKMTELITPTSFICSEHFTPSSFYKTLMTKTLSPNAIPTLKLPNNLDEAFHLKALALSSSNRGSNHPHGECNTSVNIDECHNKSEETNWDEFPVEEDAFQYDDETLLESCYKDEKYQDSTDKQHRYGNDLIYNQVQYDGEKEEIVGCPEEIYLLENRKTESHLDVGDYNDDHMDDESYAESNSRVADQSNLDHQEDSDLDQSNLDVNSILHEIKSNLNSSTAYDRAEKMNFLKNLLIEWGSEKSLAEKPKREDLDMKDTDSDFETITDELSDSTDSMDSTFDGSNFTLSEDSIDTEDCTLSDIESHSEEIIGAGCDDGEDDEFYDDYKDSSQSTDTSMKNSQPKGNLVLKFNKLSGKDKILKILEWLNLPESLIKKVKDNDYRIQWKDIKNIKFNIDNISESLCNEKKVINLAILRNQMTCKVYQLIQDLIYEKAENLSWICKKKECNEIINDEKTQSIMCHSCLTWWHLNCAKQFEKDKSGGKDVDLNRGDDWFCSKCILDNKSQLVN